MFLRTNKQLKSKSTTMVASIKELKDFIQEKSQKTTMNFTYLTETENNMIADLVRTKYMFSEDDRDEMLDDIAKHPEFAITRHTQYRDMFVLAHIAEDNGVYFFSVKKFKF